MERRQGCAIVYPDHAGDHYVSLGWPARTVSQRGDEEQKRGASHTPGIARSKPAAQASGRPSLPERWELPDMPAENGQRRWFPDEPVARLTACQYI